MSLPNAVAVLSQQVTDLSGKVVSLNQAVNEMAETFIPRDEVDERERQTVKVVRTIVIAASLVITSLIGGFWWIEHQRDLQQIRTDKFGAEVVSCVVAAQDEMRQAMDAHFGQTAEFTGKDRPPTAPVNGLTREDVKRYCEPIRGLLQKKDVTD